MLKKQTQTGKTVLEASASTDANCDLTIARVILGEKRKCSQLLGVLRNSSWNH